MQTTVELDDEMIARAKEYTGLEDQSALMREALKALIEREAAHSLARMGGTMPDLIFKPRSRRSNK